ncbi:N6-adenosine-methyltransferase MT-A70-like protein [Drosophila guanche]|uniref:mRNA m(6)A methyltransferase n=1 Tax=Drosophila guanche TaxID=7266 RepID=A0A3B0K435_DROGU|nr:N6-adenosine-methyltransferase MT-A70-like protein [Drosophila guanche]SPP82740.1 blast:Probable N6-adenosine-methyltransferase MT-A70-like protein [Drosophila guanche]
MADAWDIKTLKTKRNTLREKLEKRKKERIEILSDIQEDQTNPKKELVEADLEVQKEVLQALSACSLALPIVSTQVMEKIAAAGSSLEMVNFILGKLANQGAISIRNVTIGTEAGCEIISVQPKELKEILEDINDTCLQKEEEAKRKLAELVEAEEDVQPLEKTMKMDCSSRKDAPNDIMMLLSMPSTREKQSKQVGEEILELLTKPTAKERSVAEKFKSHGGAQVMEFCSHGTKVECLKAQQATAEMAAKKKQERLDEQALRGEDAGNGGGSSSSKKPPKAGTPLETTSEDGEVISETLTNCEGESQESTDGSDASGETRDKCTKLHFKKIIQAHTDESLGDCSFLNTCFHMATCKYVHYEVDTLPHINTNKPTDVKTKLSLKRSIDPSCTLYPPQWIQCDLRFLDMTVLGKFAVVMADPPWDIHMELPYGTMSDDEMRALGVPALQDDGLIFLWVTGRAMELGRDCLKLWGYERVDELIWVKTNQLQRIIRTGRTGHWLNHGKEHCLVGMKGNPTNLNRGLDCDVIVAEVRATSHKPDEIYGIIERLSPGTRKIELFGRPHNIQPNWITLGNQLDGIRLVDPELITQFQKRYPDGNCMSPAAAANAAASINGIQN